MHALFPIPRRQHAFHLVHRALLHVRQYVRIGVQRELYARMPEHLRNDPRMHPCREKKRGACMPQIVETNGRRLSFGKDKSPLRRKTWLTREHESIRLGLSAEATPRAFSRLHSGRECGLLLGVRLKAIAWGNVDICKNRGGCDIPGGP